MEHVERATVIGTTTIHEAAAPRPEDGKLLSLVEKLAFLHREASTMQPGGDLVAFKFQLKGLVADVQRLLGEVDGELNRQRKIERAAEILR